VEECASFCSKHFPKDTHHLQLAYMIPGILHPEKSPAQIQAGKALRTLGVNVIGPMLLAKHFSPYLPRKATETLPSADDSMKGLPKTAVMAMMSARVGSITDNKLGGWYSYRASKAAVNQLVKSLDIYANQTSGGKSMVLGLHPGTVKTDFSEEFWASVGERGMLSPEQSANHLHRVVLEHGESGEGGGRCWDWKGIEVPP
jgi:NAD(P)-dependent dehydrogenase (short-subunit alcohol dehydrogenase family)